MLTYFHSCGFCGAPFERSVSHLKYTRLDRLRTRQFRIRNIEYLRKSLAIFADFGMDVAGQQLLRRLQ